MSRELMGRVDREIAFFIFARLHLWVNAIIATTSLIDNRSLSFKEVNRRCHTKKRNFNHYLIRSMRCFYCDPFHSCPLLELTESRHLINQLSNKVQSGQMRLLIEWRKKCMWVDMILRYICPPSDWIILCVSCCDCTQWRWTRFSAWISIEDLKVLVVWK